MYIDKMYYYAEPAGNMYTLIVPADVGVNQPHILCIIEIITVEVSAFHHIYCSCCHQNCYHILRIVGIILPRGISIFIIFIVHVVSGTGTRRRIEVFWDGRPGGATSIILAINLHLIVYKMLVSVSRIMKNNVP